MTSERFRRLGQVRAERLTRPLEWTTAHGDMLHGEVGDWIVTALDGSNERTVKPAAFEKTYEPVGDGIYRRTGVVRAYQVDASTAVATLEGEARAEVGDWIVTDDQGNSWPVPDDVFRQGYEPL